MPRVRGHVALRDDLPGLRWIYHRRRQGWSITKCAWAMGVHRATVQRLYLDEFARALAAPHDDESSEWDEQWYPQVPRRPRASWAEREQHFLEKQQEERERKRLQKEREAHTAKVIEENQRVYGVPNPEDDTPPPARVVKARQAEAARQERRQARGEQVMRQQRVKAARAIVVRYADLCRHLKPGGLEGYAQKWNLRDEMETLAHAAANFAWQRDYAVEVNRRRGVYPGDVISQEAPHPPWARETVTAARVFRNREQANSVLAVLEHEPRRICNRFGVEVMTWQEARELVKESGCG